MAHLFRSWSAWATVLAFGLFWLVTSFTPPHLTIEFLRIAQVSLSTVVAVSFLPTAWAGFRSATPHPVEQVAQGIFLMFTASAGAGLWFLLWRLAGQPVWMLDGRVAELLIFLPCVGAVLHIIAPGAVEGIPKVAKLQLGLAVGAAVFVFLMLAWYSPNLGPLFERLRPAQP